MFSQRFKLILVLATLFLIACGSNDASTSSQNSGDDSIQLYGAKVATSVANLPTCDSKQVGQLFYVLADQRFQFCSSEGFQTIDLRGTAGVDGVDGKDGANGVDGSDGSSCSVISNANGSKTILCEDGSTATLNDGASCKVADNGNGSYDLTCSGTTVTVRDGRDGVDGTSCTVSDDGAGTLTQTCGTSVVSWPKALCGTQPYDPSTHFCSGQTAIEFCGTQAYEPTIYFCDLRDNHLYKHVTIGTQTWMAENLAYLPSVNAQTDRSNTEIKYYVYNYNVNYNNDAVMADAKAITHYTTYGVLYNWPAAMAGACPAGWHIPSSAEWTTLETYVGGASTGGTMLKSVSGWTTGGDIGTDAYGFSALPGGYYYEFFFYSAVNYGYWWTATEFDATNAYFRGMFYNRTNVGSDFSFKGIGSSVRCLQD